MMAHSHAKLARTQRALANDLKPRSANRVLVTGPTNGTLMLNAEGSFVWTPTSGLHGTDSFFYQASDGMQLSRSTFRVPHRSCADNEVMDRVWPATSDPDWSDS
jgi:hypothetical protein